MDPAPPASLEYVNISGISKILFKSFFKKFILNIGRSLRKLSQSTQCSQNSQTPLILKFKLIKYLLLQDPILLSSNIAKLIKLPLTMISWIIHLFTHLLSF